MDAFVDLAQVHHFQPEDIASIRVELSAAALRELVTPEPRTGDEAKFSVGFQVALYLSGLDNMPDNYTEKIIFRPDIQRIIKATHLCHAERYDALPVDMGVGPAFVSVTLLDGTEYHTERIYPWDTGQIPFRIRRWRRNSCAVPARYWVRSRRVCYAGPSGS